MAHLTLADIASRTMPAGRGNVAKKHWIKDAIKHPGIEKAKAKRNGVSTRQQLQKDSHSDNPSVRARGKLGLRFEKKGDLHAKTKSRSERWYG
jgi:hypothetical protein